MDALSGERLRIAFTASRELWEMLSRARELLRGRHPDGRFEELFHEALAALLREIDPLVREPAKRRESNVGGDRARHIPKAVRDEVWRRDQGRCTFVSPGGDRCPASGRLELDHIVPWALGGRPDAGNLRLRCRAHNLLSARRAFGARAFV